MARPIKRSLDYFPLDVNIFNDRKIKRLIKMAGGKAFSVYVYLLAQIYSDNGYFTTWDLCFAEDIADALGEGFDEDFVNDTLSLCLSLGLFDEEIFKKYEVLTSRSIQTRFIEIKSINSENLTKFIDEKLNLLNDEKINFIKPSFTELNEINSDKNYLIQLNEVKPDLISFNEVKPSKTELNRVFVLKESKVKESKENKNKEKEKKEIKEKKEKENTPPLSPQGETVEIQPNNILLIPESFKEETDSAVEIPEKLNTEKFVSTWQEWEKYRKEKRQTLKPSTIRKQFEFLAAYDVETAIKIIEQSIMQGWTGLFELKKQNNSNRSTSQGNSKPNNPEGGLFTPEKIKVMEEFLNGD